MYSYFDKCVLMEAKSARGCAGLMDKAQKGDDSERPLRWQVTALLHIAGGLSCWHHGFRGHLRGKDFLLCVSMLTPLQSPRQHFRWTQLLPGRPTVTTKSTY